MGSFKMKEIRSHPMIGMSACRCFGDDRSVLIKVRFQYGEIRGCEFRKRGWTISD